MPFEPTDLIEFIFDSIRKIMDSINDDDHITMLTHTDLLMKVMGNKFIKEKKLTNIKNKISKTLKDEPNMRILRLMQRIKKEIDTSVEYFGADIGSDERLFYQEEMEKEMIIFQEEIRQALAKIIKEKTGTALDID